MLINMYRSAHKLHLLHVQNPITSPQKLETLRCLRQKIDPREALDPARHDDTLLMDLSLSRGLSLMLGALAVFGISPSACRYIQNTTCQPDITRQRYACTYVRRVAHVHVVNGVVRHG